MRAGRLRHRIALQEAVEARNALGETIRTWSTLATVWGSVEPLRGREYVDNRREQSDVTTRIVIRYRTDIDNEMRAFWEGHNYEIQSVTFDPGRRQLELMCVEVENG